MKPIAISGFLFAACALAGFCASQTNAATPSASQALKLAPTQDGVDYDRPKAEEIPRCKISAKKFEGHIGWVIESPEGVILRKFLDTNGDNVVDQWSYYKDGVEVYRDIAAKSTGKADEFRWLNTAGTRWGVDAAGDGKVTSWKIISAEEATAEIVAAIAKSDADRFARLLLTSSELQSLGLGKAKADALAAKIEKSGTEFRALIERQRAITPDSKWVQFSGNRPGIVPAGTDDSTRDLEVYENVMAIVQTGDKHTQVQIGTLVRVGSTWKTIDTPIVSGEGQPEVAAAGFFFQSSAATRNQSANVPNDEAQKMISEMEGMEPGDARRVEIIQKLADQAKTADERNAWLRQLADTLGAGVQTGKIVEGETQLQALFEKAKKDSDTNLAAYVKIRMLTAGYARAISEPKADFAKIQAEYLKNLEQFVADYATSPDAAEAMLQLGNNREYAGQDDDAKKWYERIGHDFADSSQAKKAAGAALRLECVGKPINISGKGLTGGRVDLASYRGKVVVVQYWASWCVPAKNDMANLKQLATKYGKSFDIIGVSLDNSAKELNAYLSENPLPWQQIFEEGGQDSRPATMLGIITVPTMILVDADGKVVSRNTPTTELEAEVKKLIR